MPGFRISTAALAMTAFAGAAPLDFNDDIRPLLSDRCFKCHGFDAKTREADLRLDVPEVAYQTRKSGRAIVPGDLDASLLWQRITSDDPDDVMPPPDSNLSLNATEKALLKRWIEEGAEYKKHWALIPIERPAVPVVRDATLVRNPLDAFVGHRLEREKLTFAPEAPKRSLIRRLSLDLRGLPPTPAEVAAYLQDDAPDAYGKLVDRFLASPSFGERMAWPWLNAARYADSNGYQGDKERTMWPWRDWVVDALNRNVPWDDLTTWQLAGDLLPEATFEQKLATGFLRNHPINGEGGRIPEENRVDYVMDMAETTGTVWLGLTFNCCRCHDHKYDPLTQEEYYQLFAFFNQTPVDGGGGDPQTAPVLTVPTPDAGKREAMARQELAKLEGELETIEQDLQMQQEDWERQRRDSPEPSPWHGLVVRSAEAKVQDLEVLDDGSILASGKNPDHDTYTVTATTDLAAISGIRLEAIRHTSMTEGGLARSNSGNFVLTGFEISIVPEQGAGAEPLKISSALASYEQGAFRVTTAYDGKPGTGWAVHEGRPVDRDHEAVFRLAAPAEIPPGAAIVVTLRHDSSNKAHNLGRFRLSVSNDPEASLGMGEDQLMAVLALDPAKRSKDQARLVAQAHRKSDPRHAQLGKSIAATKKQIESIRKELPKVMVMADRERRRESFVLEVGAYDNPGKIVTAGTPASLPPMADDFPRNRLGLARWLVAPDNPLPARVTVNRIWQEFFGAGLVKSPENFGVQSEMPVHPQLLDWLAAGFIDSGWDVKALVRTIVTSRTYRQSSRVDALLLARDPANQLLARGPRFRMPAWMIRDQALAASGLLVERRGGPPVMPYQPPGLWAEATFGKKKYKPDTGEALYRRSLYTFWRRIAAPPMFFDNPGRETCAVKDGRTNTPLHALSTLNDVTYTEAARALAARAARDAGSETAAQLRRAFEIVLCRPPSSAEFGILEHSFDRAEVRFTGDPKAARDFLGNGESPRNSDLPETEHAALATVCLGILNLDETLTKE